MVNSSLTQLLRDIGETPTAGPYPRFRQRHDARQRFGNTKADGRCAALGRELTARTKTARAGDAVSTLYISHPCFLLHQTPAGHPERPDRMRVVERILEHERFAPLEREASPVATTEALMRAHPESYIRALEDASPAEGMIQLDADTTMSPGTLEAALRASGGAILAVDEVMTGKVANAFVGHPAARPPRRERTAMGFCFFNHAAIAARHAQRRMAPSASPSSTGTSTTATAPRTSSGPIRASCTARPTRCRSIRAPARPVRDRSTWHDRQCAAARRRRRPGVPRGLRES
jgi:hypothetical protein